MISPSPQNTSLTTTEPDEHSALRMEIVQMLYSGNSRSMIVSMIVAATLIYVEMGMVKDQILWGWAIVFIMAYTARYVLTLIYHQNQNKHEHSKLWLRLFRIATAGCGIAWGLAGNQFYHGTNSTDQAFIIIILLGVSGGAIINYAIDSITASLFSGGLYLFALPTFLSQTDTLSIAISAMFTIYIIYVWISSSSVAKKMHENILMRITADKQEQKIKALAERQKLHVDLTPMGVIEWDANLRVISWNSAAERIFHYSADKAIQMHVSKITPIEEQDNVLELMHHFFEDGSTQCFQTRNLRQDGKIIFCEWTYTALKDKNGNVIGLATLVQDKTLFKKNQDDIQQLVNYDLLTNLPNRRLLMDRLEHALIASKRSKLFGATLFVDLDKFKDLNELHGHQVGDLLLQEVAHRLKKIIREEDTLARFSGDEFVIVLEDLDETSKEAMRISSTIVDKIISGINQVYILGEHEHRITVSIGVCLFLGKELPADEILKRADIAMNQVKKAGQNGMQFFNESLQPELELRAQLNSDLHGAVFNIELIPYYQAQVNQNHEVIGAELLLRWNHPKYGFISPAEFIPIAEESNLINSIGLSILRHACQQIAAWQRNQSTRHLRLSINISARHFEHINFVDDVKQALADASCPPHLLRLELTESLMQANINELAHKMKRLKTMGVSLSLDDFGTGYSSLSALRNFPIDELKIDRSFVINMLKNDSEASIVEMIIAIGKKLGMEVIAEGIETVEQEIFLRNAGCLNYQGYKFGRPVPIDEFQQQLKQAK
jgi:diguanylate cyclase (GGDEF)-like protein/PAS domain S-box-containing protein